MRSFSVRKFLSVLLAIVTAFGCISVCKSVDMADDIRYELDISYDEEIEKLANLFGEEAAYWKSFSSGYFFEGLSSEEKYIYFPLDMCCMTVLLNTTTDYDYTGYHLYIGGLGLEYKTYIETFMDCRAYVLYSNPQYYFLGVEQYIAWDFSYEGEGETQKTYFDSINIRLFSEFEKASQRNMATENIRSGDYYYSESEWGLHTWNMINLHGFWYYVDVTHDDFSDHDGIHYNKYNSRQLLDETGNQLIPTLACMRSRVPSVEFDELDEGDDLKSYSPRYFEDSGKNFFIVNDLADDECGLIVKCIDEEWVDVEYVEHNGSKYRVCNYKKADPTPPDTPTPATDTPTPVPDTPTPEPATPTPEPAKDPSFEDFVERLYTVWLGLLNNGTSRTDAMKAFASCPEFQEICNQYGIDRGEIV